MRFEKLLNICRLAFGSILKEVIGEEKILEDSESDYDGTESQQKFTPESKNETESEGFFSESCKDTKYHLWII